MSKLLPRQRFLAATALMLCWMATGCESTGGDDAPAEPVDAQPAMVDWPPEPPVDRAAAPPPNPLTKPPAPPPVQAALLAPPPPPPVALRLNGLSMAQTESELGRPAAEADRAPAKVWQYRAGDCAVDVYFYLDMARNGFYALHHDAKRGDTADENCIRVVQEAGHVR